MTHPNVDEIKELFDIGSKGDSDDYGTFADDAVDPSDFEDLAKQASQDISPFADKAVKLTHKPQPDTEPDLGHGTEPIQTEPEEAKPEDLEKTESPPANDLPDDPFDFGKIPDSDQRNFSEQAEEYRTEQEKARDNPQPEQSQRPITPRSGAPLGQTEKVVDMNVSEETRNSDAEWLLDPPTDKYAAFYHIKSDALRQILPNGRLDFDRITQELKDSKIDVSLDVFDRKVIGRQMSQLGGILQRVAQIQIDLNNQYFAWKRHLELLRGALARVEYEKPALRQGGVVYEHLRDFEHYFEQLEGCYFGANHVYKTLDTLFDCLSRQLTIVLRDEDYDSVHPAVQIEHQKAQDSFADEPSHPEPKSKPRSKPKPKPKPKQDKSDLDDYDSVEEGASATSKKKTGVQDWSDLFSK